jgi:hypothetical protein
MPAGNPGIRHYASAGGKAKAARRLTPERVEAALGQLATPEDAKRQLRQLVLWGASGLLAGTVLNGSVRGLEVWLKAHAEQVDVERVKQLEQRVRELDAELKQRRQ